MAGIEKLNRNEDHRALAQRLADTEAKFWNEWRDRVSMQIDDVFAAAAKGEDVVLLYPGGKTITLRPVAD